MPTTELTAAHFALCAGHTATPAMHADVLVAAEVAAVVAPVATEAEVSAYIAAVIRNQFSRDLASPEVRAAAVARLQASIATMAGKRPYKGQKAEIAHGRKLLDWIS